MTDDATPVNPALRLSGIDPQDAELRRLTMVYPALTSLLLVAVAQNAHQAGTMRAVLHGGAADSADALVRADLLLQPVTVAEAELNKATASLQMTPDTFLSVQTWAMAGGVAEVYAAADFRSIPALAALYPRDVLEAGRQLALLCQLGAEAALSMLHPEIALFDEPRPGPMSVGQMLGVLPQLSREPRTMAPGDDIPVASPVSDYHKDAHDIRRSDVEAWSTREADKPLVRGWREFNRLLRAAPYVPTDETAFPAAVTALRRLNASYPEAESALRPVSLALVSTGPDASVEGIASRVLEAASALGSAYAGDYAHDSPVRQEAEALAAKPSLLWTPGSASEAYSTMGRVGGLVVPPAEVGRLFL